MAPNALPLPDTQQPQEAQLTADTNGRKPYTPPAIKHELVLETRAGSPLGMLNPFDPRPRV
jgi:hypothetical protein